MFRYKNITVSRFLFLQIFLVTNDMLVEYSAWLVNEERAVEAGLKSNVAKLQLLHNDLKTIADFRLAMASFQAFSNDILEELGLGPQRYQALIAIRARPSDDPMTVGGLAEQLAIRPNTAAEMTKRMEAAGLITRTRYPDNLRVVRLELTAEGEELLARAIAADLERLQSYRDIFRDLLKVT